MNNKELCNKYPWLCPYNIFDDNLPKNFDYEYTWLDAMPGGWRAAFGEQMCEEIQKVLEKVNYVDKYRILQIKEKWGYLHWYSDIVPQEIDEEYERIIEKYEKLSQSTCIHCGAPATKISTGWISPWCDKCYNNLIPIDIGIKKQEELS